MPVLDATHTFDLPAHGGGTLTADELARGTATNLQKLLPLLVPLVAALAPPALPAGGPQGPAAQERLEIVDRAIAHHGGEIYTSSETRMSLCSKSGCARLATITDGWEYEYEVTARSGDGERRVRITNDTVEQWIDGEPVEVAPERLQPLRDGVMARVYFAFLPYRLNDPSVLKQDLGVEDWAGRTLHRVRVTFVPGSSTDAEDVFLFWFDPASARLEQFAYSFTRGEGGLRFRRAFNYRRVGGILFFDQENLGVDGPGFDVDDIDPDFVERRMSRVSTVELHDLDVRRLRE